MDTRHAAAARVFANQCKNVGLLIVVGIGGSNLGTMAVQQAVLGMHFDRVLYADTTDPDSLYDIIHRAKDVLRRGKQVVVNIVSKSGTTAETIANASVILEALGKKDVFVLATSDSGSPLEAIARRHSFHTLQVPKHVGGRYSVFSSVGLFPLAVLGVNIEQLLEGAQTMLFNCLHPDVARNPALMLASISYLHWKEGRRVQNTFVFSNGLEGINRWYRQLLGESIGKTPKSGILPTMSVGSTDLHSLGQLYLAGMDSMFHRIIVSTETRHDMHIPATFHSLVPELKRRRIGDVMYALRQGTETAFRKRKKPFIEIELSSKSPEVIGGLLQTFMIEIMLLGHLLKVNPFDQPAVEEYKVETRNMLGKK
jgi:glucose-6-phosphate isomerase